MNLALIHEKLIIKSFWEQRIDKHSHVSETEESRMKKSALGKLRDEWLWRMEARTKHLKTFNEERLKRTKPEKQLEELQQREEKKAREDDEGKDNREANGTQEVENSEDVEEMEQNGEEEPNENSEEQEETDVVEETEVTEVNEESGGNEPKDTEQDVEITLNGEVDSEEMQTEKPEMEIEPTEQE
ncbi:retrotransposon-like protein 1 [Sardina pilchardus]|uniref:retrotransposon-like protein 1 n=1 Tax=Sardina pilchardus TaxID=27697 RepID=UPI002E0D86F5